MMDGHKRIQETSITAVRAAGRDQGKPVVIWREIDLLAAGEPVIDLDREEERERERKKRKERGPYCDTLSMAPPLSETLKEP